MPDPIQSSVPNQSYYNPADEVSRAPEPGAASYAPASAAAGAAAGQGTQLLVKQYGEGGIPSCDGKLVSATVSVTLASSGVVGTLAVAPTGIGAVLGGIAVAGAITKAVNDVVGYLECKEDAQEMAEAAQDCDQRDGVLLRGAGSRDFVCFSTEQ